MAQEKEHSSWKGPSEKEVVVLVHGTFAGDDSDDGDKWWQKNSETWASIADRLPENVRLNRVFHWADGPNSMRGRTTAALSLLNWLEDFEREGRGYHLIGHSHGGSVIWDALRQSTIRRLKIFRSHGKGRYARRGDATELKHLRSWTTVGTPFMELSPSKGWNLGLFGKVGRGLEFLLDKMPLLSSLLSLAAYYIAAATLFGVIVFGFMFWLIPDFRLPHNLTYADALRSFVIWSAILILVVPFALSQTERWQLIREIEVSKRTFAAFGDKWLGLISKHDEALAALTTSQDFDLQIIPKRTLAQDVFYSDQLYSWTKPWRKAFNAFVNLVNRPLNAFVLSALKNKAHGNDRPGAIVSKVTPLPVADTFEGIFLPDSIDNEIVEFANNRAQTYIPEARQFLGAIAISGYQISELGQPTNELKDFTATLVHNSYFDCQSLVDLILWHISVASKCCSESDFVRIDRQLVAWADEQKIHIEEQIKTLT